MFCRALALFAAVLAISGPGKAWAFGKAPSPSAAPQAKTVVRLDPIQDVVISLPSAINPMSTTVTSPIYDFGPNLVSSLANKMVNGHYILDEPRNQQLALRADATPGPTPSPTPPVQWDGSTLVPAAEFKFYIDALNLRTGTRGDQMFYGFDERFRTPYNDGTGANLNEFPLSLVAFQPNWFDRTFDDQGGAPFDSQSGLDLGQGFSLNALVAWLSVKYAEYNSEIRMRVEMDAPLAGRHEIKSIEVKGGGFYFDIVGGYEQWSGGIGLARTDALGAAFQNAFAGAYSAIDDWVKNLPLTALVFRHLSPNQIYLNTGENSNIPVGTKYVSTTNPGLVFEVTQDVPGSGSLGKLDSGDFNQIQDGMVLLEQQGARVAALAARIRAAAGISSNGGPTPVAPESVNLASTNLPESNFGASPTTAAPNVSFWDAFWASITEGWALPYRIWRYYQYDGAYNGPYGQMTSQAQAKRAYRLEPAYQGPDLSSDDAQDNSGLQGAEDWADEVKGEPFAHQIGLDTAPAMTSGGPLIAVIDSGVDYNHPALRDRIWQNPSPVVDADGNSDEIGWDFISGDPRPYDDSYHGTEIASAILGVAPLATIMPLKIFNPFGVTSSAAIYGAFQYAVVHGAKIIVAAWATRLQTKTLQTAIQYAHDHEVLVVTSAGDHGDDLSKVPAYPASLSKSFDNVIAVAGVDSNDKIVQVSGFYSNYDPGTVVIAAPGQDILVAQPRDHTSRQTTSGIAAGLVAGAIARDLAASGAGGSQDYHAWIQALKAQSQPVPGLAASVAGGLRLRVK